MNQREKVLAGAIVGLLFLWAGWRGYASYEDSYDRRVDQLRRLDDELFDQEMAGRAARQALARLERYQAQSLPTDPDVAQSAYREWLIAAVAEAGLELETVKSTPTRRSLDGAATALEFDATATGPAEAVARFLDAYYRLDALHQITVLNLRPAAGGSEPGDSWAMTFKSVTLSVEGAERTAGLPEEPREPRRLRLATADEYVESLVGRNVFANYTPPPPPRPDPPKVAKRPPPPKKPEPPPFDDSEHSSLTGIVGAGENRQAWVLIRTTGRRLYLKAGDEFEIGTLKGRVQAVLAREMIVESEDGSTWRAGLGDKLREAQAAGDA